MNKRYTVKAYGIDETTGKKIWAIYDKESEQFLSQFEGGRFQLQDTAKQLNEGTLSLNTGGRKIGYMRISKNTENQTFERQKAQLESVGCDVIYQDKISGAKRERPQLNSMLESLQEGDTVYIVAIDRLSRSTKDLLEIVDLIKSKGAYLKSLNDSWLDTSKDNPMSDFLVTIMGALAQMERAMIQQRIKEGVAVAKAKGTKLGRPKANSNKVSYALELYATGEHTIKQIIDITGISKATLYRKIKEAEELAKQNN